MYELAEVAKVYIYEAISTQLYKGTSKGSKIIFLPGVLKMIIILSDNHIPFLLCVLVLLMKIPVNSFKDICEKIS